MKKLILISTILLLTSCHSSLLCKRDQIIPTDEEDLHLIDKELEEIDTDSYSKNILDSLSRVRFKHKNN